MATFTSTVSYAVDGNVIDIADNDFRIIEQNGELAQWGTIDITDMYPSANFTFGFNLTITEDPTTVAIPFVISFYDTETRFKFNFLTTNAATQLTVVMENDVEGVIQSYTLFNASKPSLYPSSAKKILIRLLNGYLWVKVGSTFWIEKLDIQAHPLHLEAGIIQFSVTNTTVLVSHRIQQIYFEPILCVHDPTYFAKSIFPESYENLKLSDIEIIDIGCSNLTVKDNGYIGSNLYVSSNVYVGSNLYVNSNIYTSNIDFKGDIYKNGVVLTLGSGGFGDIYLDTNDIVVDVPTGAIMFDMTGNTYINDPTFAKCGLTVNRDDYKTLANEIGIPTSQTTFTLPNPTVQRSWVTPQFLFNIVPLAVNSVYSNGGRIAGWWENNYTFDINCTALNAYNSLQGIFTAKIKGVYRFTVCLGLAEAAYPCFKKNDITFTGLENQVANFRIYTGGFTGLANILSHTVLVDLDIGNTFCIGAPGSQVITTYCVNLNIASFPSNFSGELIYSA